MDASQEKQPMAPHKAMAASWNQPLRQVSGEEFGAQEVVGASQHCRMLEVLTLDFSFDAATLKGTGVHNNFFNW